MRPRASVKQMAVSHSSEPEQEYRSYDWSYALAGARNIASLPALVLLSAFVGYGSVTREAGMSLAEAMFSVPVTWALPSMLLLVAGIASGASLLTIAVAVALASLRMLPMTMALVPSIRAPHSKSWHLMLATSFVAVTAWVHTLHKAPSLPPEGRVPYFLGFVGILILGAVTITAVVFTLAGRFPPIVLAALYFLTPLYFSIMIWRTARDWSEHLALVLGLILGPLVGLGLPEYNILLGGLAAGLIGYGVHRWWRSRVGAS